MTRYWTGSSFLSIAIVFVLAEKTIKTKILPFCFAVSTFICTFAPIRLSVFPQYLRNVDEVISPRSRTEEYTRPISRGIVGQALKDGLDVSDKPQRMKATHNLLGQISWKGTSDFMSDIAIRRTIDLSEGMNVTKKLTSALLLAAGGRGGISAGGVGVSGELTNWDGSKKKNGWGIS